MVMMRMKSQGVDNMVGWLSHKSTKFGMVILYPYLSSQDGYHYIGKANFKLTEGLKS